MKTITGSAILLVVVWSTGVLAAAALTYGLSRPLTVVLPAATTTPQHAASPDVVPFERGEEGLGGVVDDEAQQAITPIPIINAAPVLIIGRFTTDGLLVKPKPLAPIEEPRARELSEMRCSSWQDVAQGPATSRVRRCE